MYSSNLCVGFVPLNNAIGRKFGWLRKRSIFFPSKEERGEKKKKKKNEKNGTDGLRYAGACNKQFGMRATTSGQALKTNSGVKRA